MALSEGSHFFKTRKEESKQILAKYSRQNDPAYLEAAWEVNAKLFDRVPYVGREGMEIQLKDAVSKKPSSTLKVDDVIDDTIVTELEKEGFFDRLYKRVTGYKSINRTDSPGNVEVICVVAN